MDCCSGCAQYPQSSPIDYSTDGISPDLTPSPLVLFNNLENMHFNPAQYPEPFQYFDAQSPTPSVEFTDLTSLHHEDRRKKRSGSVRDKQTISTMHMRRREQNRASQRAFRERKEKHTQELQQQLDEMKKKYQKLMKSYDDLGTVNAKMRAEMDELREKAKVSQSYEDDSLSNMDDSDIFYQLLSEEDLQADSKLEFES